MTVNPLDDGPFAPLLAELDHRLGADLPAARHLGPREITGRLEGTDVIALVGGAFRRVFSGRLVLSGDELAGSIWFEAGRPIDVALRTTAPGGRAGEGAAAAEQRFFKLATVASGRFAFEPREAGAAHRTHLLRHPARLAHEALARQSGQPGEPGHIRLLAWRGSDANRWRLTPGPVQEGLVEAAVEDPALRVALRLFDGVRSFREVVTGSRQPEVSLLRAAYVLFCFGALEPAGEVAAAERVLAADRGRIQALFALAQESDYFTFLGVDRTASSLEIGTAVERLAREIEEQRLLPDVALATGRERAIIAGVIAEAARILGHDRLRQRYREALPKLIASD